MPAGAEVHVRGLREVSRAFAAAGKEAKRELRQELQRVAEPVRSDAELLARTEIRNIGDRWPRMRVGVTTRSVYVAPAQRGVKGRGYGGRRRPNLAGLLMDRAMQPALERNRGHAERAVELMLDRLADHFNRGA